MRTQAVNNFQQLAYWKLDLGCPNLFIIELKYYFCLLLLADETERPNGNQFSLTILDCEFNVFSFHIRKSPETGFSGLLCKHTILTRIGGQRIVVTELHSNPPHLNCLKKSNSTSF